MPLRALRYLDGAGNASATRTFRHTEALTCTPSLSEELEAVGALRRAYRGGIGGPRSGGCLVHHRVSREREWEGVVSLKEIHTAFWIRFVKEIGTTDG